MLLETDKLSFKDMVKQFQVFQENDAILSDVLHSSHSVAEKIPFDLPEKHRISIYGEAAVSLLGSQWPGESD